MSSKQIIRLGLMAGSGLAMMGLTACASGHSTTRYGGYDYEKGQNCGSACVAPGPVYNDAYAPVPVSPGPVYVDCNQLNSCGTMAPAPTTVYTAPTTTYVEPTTSYNTSTYSGQMADCPAGTTMQSDGTCMQPATSSYSGGTVIIPSAGTSYSSTTTSADCPAGTTMQSDGTCMQSSSGYSSYSSTTTYTAPTTVSCPAGTTMASDGTCMQSGSSSYTYSTGGGYQSTGTTDYRPLRK